MYGSRKPGSDLPSDRGEDASMETDPVFKKILMNKGKSTAL